MEWSAGRRARIGRSPRRWSTSAAEGLDRHHRDAFDQAGFERVGGGDEDEADALLAGDADHRQDAVGVAHLAVEGQLAQEQGALVAGRGPAPRPSPRRGRGARS